MFPLLRQLRSSRRARRLIHIFLVSLGLVLAIAVFYVPSISQSIRNARIVEIIEKPDTLRILINETQAKTGDEASLGQRVVTEQEARTGLRLTQAAAIRLGKNSSFTIGGECIQLENGRALVSATRGCIGSVIATNRGTIYVMERTGPQGEIKVLEGSVAMSNLANPAIQPTIVNQGQKITVRATGELGPINPILRPEFEAILAGELFQGFQVQLPNQARLTAVLQQLPVSAAAQPAAPTAPQPAPSSDAATAPQSLARLQTAPEGAEAREGPLPASEQESETGPDTESGRSPVSRRFLRRFFGRSPEAESGASPVSSQGEDTSPLRERSRRAPVDGSGNEASDQPNNQPPDNRPSDNQPSDNQLPDNRPEDESGGNEPPPREPPVWRQPPSAPPPFGERPQPQPQAPPAEFDPDGLRQRLRQERDEIRQRIRQQFPRNQDSTEETGGDRQPERPTQVDIPLPQRQPREQPQRSSELQ